MKRQYIPKHVAIFVSMLLLLGFSVYIYYTSFKSTLFVPKQLHPVTRFEDSEQENTRTWRRNFTTLDVCKLNGSTCRRDFCAEFKPPGKKLHVVNLNPNGHGCGIAYTDEQLINLCRRNLPFYDTKGNTFRLEPPPLLFTVDDEMKKLQRKYNDRVQGKHQCETSKGMWGNPFNSRCAVVTAGIMGQYQRGQVVLDFGAGCGHQATFMTQVFGVHVVGIDINAAAIQWATDHSIGEFHQTNGQDLSWIPDETFDHMYSFASVYYIPLEEVCFFSNEIIRILKPGGTAFFGWLYGYYSDNLGKFAKQSWACIADSDASVIIFDDVTLFKADPSNKDNPIISDTGSYSVLLRKKKSTV